MQNVFSFTGHRPPKLGGYGPLTFMALNHTATVYLKEQRPDCTITGAALGWDLAAMLASIELGIPCHAAVPFIGQERLWPVESQAMYRDVLSRCASVTVVSDGGYSAAKMQVRNEWMVDRATRVVALWDGSAGGTHNCVLYAQKQHKHIVNLWNRFKVGRIA